MSCSAKQLFCAPCSMWFNKQQQFNEHLASHLTKNRSSAFMRYIKPYECVICHRRFDIKSHLELHFNTHILNPDSICPYCSLDCQTIAELDIHTRQCSVFTADSSDDLDEINLSDSDGTEPSCSQSKAGSQSLSKASELYNEQELNESQLKSLALIATTSSFTQEDKSVIQESIKKSPDNSHGGLFNGKESKAYKTYLKASYRYNIPKPNYVTGNRVSVIKYERKKTQVSQRYGGSREKNYSCENCSEYFSRKCVLEMHRRKHILEEKNKLNHFNASNILKAKDCKSKFDKTQELITSSADLSHKSEAQFKNKTKSALKSLSNVVPRMYASRKASVKVIKSKISKKVPLSKSNQNSQVSGELGSSTKSVEQDKNKIKDALKTTSNISTTRMSLPYKSFAEVKNMSKIISKTSYTKPVSKVRIASKSYIKQKENKKKNISKVNINKFTPRMRLPRTCSLKAIKSKASDMDLASKNNRALEISKDMIKPGKNLKLKLKLVRRNALAVQLKIRKKYSKSKAYNLRKRNKNEDSKEFRSVKPKSRTNKKNRSNELRFKCDVCQKAFNDRFKVKRHYVQHTGEKPYSCSKCDKRFTRTDHLKRHSRICGKRAKAQK